MTETYIRGISNNISERSWTYRHDLDKSSFTAVGREDTNHPLPNVTSDKVPNTYSHTGITSALKENIVTPSSVPNYTTSCENMKISSQSYVTSASTSRRGQSYSTSGKITYNRLSPPKVVKFEDSLENNDDVSSKKYYKQSYYDPPVKFGIYGGNGGYPETSKEDEFDTIDEKVKEGKEILQRLLKSTETKSSNDTKRLSSYIKPSTEDATLSFAPIKSPLSSSWNETDELISKCDDDMSVETDSIDIKDLKELKDPVFMSTRLDLNDERPPMNTDTLHTERSMTNPTSKRSGMKNVKRGEDFQDEKLIDEIKILKEELSNHEVNSFFEMKTLKEDNEKTVAKLYGQVTNLSKQKETLEDYINQLKCSLTKKNDKCFELQEQLHKKLTLIHQLTTTDDKERHILENEVNILQGRKKTLEEQIGKMEKSLKNQYDEIRELEKRFQREKQSNIDMLRKKDEEMSSLCHRIELLTEDNRSKELEMETELQTQVERAVLKGKNMLEFELDEMKLSLNNEVERQARLQSKHQVELNHLKTNFETVRTNNTKLKQELDVCRQQNQNLEKCNLVNIKNVRDEAEFENDLLKKKIIEYERIQKSMALELIEESTKLAVVCGTSPSSSRVSSPDTYVDCNIMSEAMIVFKEHLENFRHYALSLRNENQHQRTESNEESALPSGSGGQTSAKLLRHLQNRVQQLRKENAMLRASSVCESCQNEIKSNMSDDLENSLAENDSIEKEIIPIKDHLPVHSFVVPIITLTQTYCGTGIIKDVPLENMVKWDMPYSEYNPVDFTADQIEEEATCEHTDISSDLSTTKFNDIDGQIDRRSYMGTYEIIEGIPRNPIGRTGVTGRGLLRRWGPNHIMDPIVSRWLLNENGNIVRKDGKPVLQFVAIQMKETGEWAIPGGMVDIGQQVSPILRKEFIENASNAFEDNDPAFTDIKPKIDKLFDGGLVIHKGYADDPRNTDNAWVETVVINYHDEDNDSVALIPLKNDHLRWVTVDCKLNLVSYHMNFIKSVCCEKDSYIEVP